MRTALVGLLTLSVVGCASNQMTEQEVALIQAQMQQQTLQIDCPSGCSVAYRDPRDKVALPRRTNGWDAAIALTGSAERLVSSAIVPGAMGYMAVEGFKALKGSGAIDNSVAGDVISDNAGRIGSNDDYTHDPTVVTQPDPIVVPAPEPVIVPSPDPIVVEQPVLVPGGV